MSRTLATVKLYGAILWLVVAVLWGGIRETLPDDERSAGPFLAGMAWMFAIQMVLLVLTSYIWLLSVAR